MSNVERAPVAEQNQGEFVGRAWVNTVTKEDSKLKGQKCLSLRFDRGVTTLHITPQTTILLIPNSKREGRQDADFRAIITEGVLVEA